MNGLLFNPSQAVQLKRAQLTKVAKLRCMPQVAAAAIPQAALAATGAEMAVEMHVPSSMVGLIIGKGGETIR